MADSYHHGNLKEALIKEGKKMISKDGPSAFSLRKVAEKCNVSYAAPKNHFVDKRALIRAIQNDIADNFYDFLKKIYNENKDDEDVLIKLGEGYVKYFIDNPNYYSLFFHENAIPDTIQMKDDNTITSNFKPFTLFKDVATDVLKKHNIPDEDINECILSMWSMVHGISSIHAYSFFTYHGDILDLTKKALARYVIFEHNDAD